MSTILHILRQVNVNDFIVKPKRNYSDTKIYTGGIDITICYDVFEKRRQVEYGNGTISNYFYEPKQVLQQMQVSTPNGTLFMSNNYKYDLNSNITQISNTASAILKMKTKCYIQLKKEPIWWYHPDHLGSSSYLTDYTGTPSHYYNYLPFGEEIVSQNTSSYNNVYRFSGKELDEETGLSYFGAMYYSPKWSIWLSVDPEYAKYPNWSPYNYCLNNPLNVIDPDGRDIIYINWKSDTEIKSQYIYSKGNFWLMKNVDGKMVKTN